MRNRLHLVLPLLVWAPLALPPATAQTAFPFQMRAEQDQSVIAIANNSTLNLAARALGTTVSVRVTATYQGSTTVAIGTPQLFGSADFGVTSQTEAPTTLNPAGSFVFDVTFTPRTNARAAGQINIGFTEAPAAPGSPSLVGSITLNLAGLAPDFSVNYALQADGNVLPLPAGGSLQFLPTAVNTTALASVIILNRGSGPGPVRSISVTGAAFQPFNLPLLPTTLNSGGDLRFLVRYSPTQIGADTGTMQVDFDGLSLSFILEGSGIGPRFVYEVIDDGGTIIPAVPNQPILIPETSLGETRSFTVQIANLGNADGIIQGIGVTGTGFGLTDLPFLPLTLTPNDIATFTLVFSPAQPGPINGRLRIGNDIFPLTSGGVGERLLFSFRLGEDTRRIAPGDTVFFSPLTVGQSAEATITIRNTGTTTATITSIGLAGQQTSVFRITELAALPHRLDPEVTFNFVVTFTPLNTTLATATLLVNTQSFTLSGFGSTPPPVPAFLFTGATGTQEPLRQPSVGLALAEPYPITLLGSLTMIVDSDAASPDPAVQFATGGRTVAFRIPANSMQAIFPNGLPEIRFQTGSVAGSITIIPAFTTQSGLDVTPDNPEFVRLMIPRSAPVLLGFRLAQQSATSLTVFVTGFSTTRTLSEFSFQFTAIGGKHLANGSVSLNVTADADVWYRTIDAQAFGGQFAVTVPFTLRTGSSSSSTILTDLIQSIAVTASNEIGVSSPLSLNLR